MPESDLISVDYQKSISSEMTTLFSKTATMMARMSIPKSTLFRILWN